MDPAPTSPHPLVSNQKDVNLMLDDEKIKPMILCFNEKIKLDPLVINKKPADDHSLQLGAIKSNMNDSLIAPDIEDHKEIDEKGGIRPNGAYNPAEAEEELWPKTTEWDDRPPSPTSQNIAIKQVIISESTYVSSKQGELDDEPVDHEESRPTTQMTSKRAFQSSKQTQVEQDIRWPSSPDLHKTGMKPPKVLHVIIREGAYQQAGANEAILDEFCLNSSSRMGSTTHQEIVKPRVQSPLRDPTHDSPATVTENHRSSAQPRLSSVVEESESFARREFGVNELNYMSTFSSANHAAHHLSPQHADGSGAFDCKHVSYRHNNYHHFTYNLSTTHEPSSGNFKNSKSAPAGTATRSGSAFGLFRRGTSERSGLKMGRRPVYRPNKPRKPRTLATTLLWPLLKIRNGYVGCMMGIEGTGDLTGMMQGGSYATEARYFADVPLSKSDSRNFG